MTTAAPAFAPAPARARGKPRLMVPELGDTVGARVASDGGCGSTCGSACVSSGS
ncbi:hypothetical protein ACGF3J_36950 [Streptomyces sp. NPDC048171]|uniref:hypothetical protein n=1 Tax=Streptomyces sp. NPDC048171 TaxID=3365504 RepID=UPI0037187364